MPRKHATVVFADRAAASARRAAISFSSAPAEGVKVTMTESMSSRSYIASSASPKVSASTSGWRETTADSTVSPSARARWTMSVDSAAELPMTPTRRPAGGGWVEKTWAKSKSWWTVSARTTPA